MTTSVPFRRVLVGWDCSPGAVEALRAAVSVGGDGTAHVVALAVLNGVPHAEAREDRERGQAERRQHTERLFHQARDGLPATERARVSLQIIEGADPARAVCDYAVEYGFDLLILGRHGTGGVLRRRLGRVAEAAVKADRLPVLLLGGR